MGACHFWTIVSEIWRFVEQDYFTNQNGAWVKTVSCLVPTSYGSPIGGIYIYITVCIQDYKTHRMKNNYFPLSNKWIWDLCIKFESYDVDITVKADIDGSLLNGQAPMHNVFEVYLEHCDISSIAYLHTLHKINYIFNTFTKYTADRSVFLEVKFDTHLFQWSMHFHRLVASIKCSRL